MCVFEAIRFGGVFEAIFLGVFVEAILLGMFVQGMLFFCVYFFWGGILFGMF